MLNEIWDWIKEKLSGFLGWIGQCLKSLWLRLIGFLSDLPASTWKRIGIAVPFVFFLYIVITIPFVHNIDDNLVFETSEPSGSSATVEIIAMLVEREVDTHRWTPNDPFFMPGWWIDNTPSYQSGIMNALSRFTMELRDQLGRSRGSSPVDTGLEAVASNLAIEGTRWVMDFDTSFLPTTPSETYYRDAVKQLHNYNARLASGDAIFEKRSDNFQATLDRIAQDIGSATASIDNYIADNAGGFLPDTGADDLFYQVKGKAYAYTLILKALEKDFSTVITERDIENIYTELLNSMESVVDLDPLIVTNGQRDGILSNHLATQGFNLLRARTRLKEITNILLK